MDTLHAGVTLDCAPFPNFAAAVARCGSQFSQKMVALIIGRT